MTDEERISELIILDAAGIISQEDSVELLKFMNDRQDFPWSELGEYQNLCALLSITVDQKIPSPNVRENVLKIVKKIAERKQMTQDKSVRQSRAEENYDSFELVSRHNKKSRHEAISIKDPDLSELNVLHEPKEFEEVKSRVALIKEREEFKSIQEKPSAIKEFRASDFFNDKSEKSSKPRNRNSLIIASILLIAVVGIGFIFIVSSGSENEVDKKLIENHTEELISKSEYPEEKLPVESIAENTELVESDTQIVTETIQPVTKQEIPVTESTNEEITEQIVSNTQRVELPALDPPKIIETPISEPPAEVITKPEKETSLTYLSNTPPKEQVKLEEEEGYFIAVEEMPEPIGGIAAIQEKIVYPELARRSGVQGKVYIRAYVNESGIVTKTEVIKGIGMGCDEAAANAVLKTKFKPGMQRGKTVKVQITVPITFKHK
jgi:protein TonB